MTAPKHEHTRQVLREFKRLRAAGVLSETPGLPETLANLAYRPELPTVIGCGHCSSNWERVRADGRTATVRDRVSAVVHVRAEHPRAYLEALRTDRELVGAK